MSIKYLNCEAYWGVGISSNMTYHLQQKKPNKESKNINNVFINHAICVKKTPRDVIVLWKQYNPNAKTNTTSSWIQKLLRCSDKMTQINENTYDGIKKLYTIYKHNDKISYKYADKPRSSLYSKINNNISDVSLEAGSNYNNLLFMKKAEYNNTNITIKSINKNASYEIFANITDIQASTIPGIKDVANYMIISTETINDQHKNLHVIKEDEYTIFHKLLPLQYLHPDLYDSAFIDKLETMRSLPINPITPIKYSNNEDFYKQQDRFYGNQEESPSNDIVQFMNYDTIANFNDNLLSWKNAISLFFAVDSVGTTQQIGKFSLPVEFMMLYTNINFYIYNFIISAQHIFDQIAFRYCDITLGIRGKHLGFFILMDPINMYFNVINSFYASTILLKIIYTLLSVLKILCGFGISLSLTKYLMLQISFDIMNLGITIQIFGYIFMKKLGMNRQGISQPEVMEISSGVEEAINFN